VREALVALWEDMGGQFWIDSGHNSRF
jgi:hypothetical protein